MKSPRAFRGRSEAIGSWTPEYEGGDDELSEVWERYNEAGRYCGACGNDFVVELYDKFKFYFGLKNEFEKLKELQNSLYSGIANVSAKIQRYEEVLIHDLERATPSPGPARKKSRVKNKRR